MSKTRIILAEDHEIYRLGIRLILNSQSDLQVVGEAKNGKELIDLIEKVECDLVISDYLMPNLDGVSSLLMITKTYPNLKTILLSSVEEPFLQELAFENNIQGYLFKSENKEEILEAIRKVMSGKIFYSTKQSEAKEINTSNENPFLKLTKREREIVELLARGYSRAEICTMIDITIKTLETHRTNISLKTNTKSIAQVVRLAYVWGLIQYAELNAN